MNTMRIVVLGVLFSLQVQAGTNPSPHEQAELQARAHKVARHIHDKLAKPAKTVSTVGSDKTTVNGK